MSIQHYVTATRFDGVDLIIEAEDEDGRAITLRSRFATIVPHIGDFISFGNAGVLQPDGTYFSGEGYIEATDRSDTYIKYPFRRISHDTIIQKW